MNISFSGEELLDFDKIFLENTLKEHRVSKHIRDIRLYVKAYKKSGLRRKIVLHMTASTDYGVVNFESDAWKFSWAVNTVIKKLDSFLVKKEAQEKAHPKSGPRTALRRILRRR